MSKTKTPPTGGSNGGNSAAPGEPREYRSNPEVDAKIDAYIKENPKYWEYIQAMPRDRLERSLVLNEVQKLDRQQRIRDGLMKEINRNPEMKQAYETLLKGVPENMRDMVMTQVASQAKRAIARSQRMTSQT
ncbi:MAG: hypothetical protein HY040_10285 [Planctomycetes bacterium]|nr:hypothetical protein [Planctomycetota bacterium]